MGNTLDERSPLRLFFLFLIFLTTVSPIMAHEADYYEILQDDYKIGTCEITKETGEDGNTIIITEKVYSPYDYFPGLVTREIHYDRKEKIITGYRKITGFDGGSELIRLDRTGSAMKQVLDFGRIFFIDENIPLPGKTAFIEEGSPALWEMFLGENILERDKKVEVKYLLPSADAREHTGTLEKKNDTYIFSGNINSSARLEDGKIRDIDFPGESRRFRRVKEKPQLEGDFTRKGEILKAPAYKKLFPPYREIPVKCPGHDGTMLAGVLTLPKGEGPHPAFVLVPGSGSYDREGGGLLYTISDSLARLGAITLRYDKRGVGESGGDYQKADLEDFTLDADAWVEFLAKRPEVDKMRMGILGYSEGALSAARVALDNKNIRGIILMASPSTRMFPEMATEQAVFYDNINGWAREAADSIQKNLEVIKNSLVAGHLWFQYNGCRIPMMTLRSYYLMPDPLKVVSQLRIPVLVLHGENDNVVPIRHSQNIYLELKKAGNRNITMVTFTDTGHSFGKMIPEGKAYPCRKHIKPHGEILDSIINWVKEKYYL